MQENRPFDHEDEGLEREQQEQPNERACVEREGEGSVHRRDLFGGGESQGRKFAFSGGLAGEASFAAR